MLTSKSSAVRSAVSRTSFAAGLVAASLIAYSGTARADLMSACEVEIASMCSDVTEGRGRISACLYANDGNLSGSCKAEVVEVSSGRTFQRYIPAGAQSPQGSQQEADLRAACTAASDKVCASVRPENGRLLACVYSRSNTMSEPCQTAAKAILN